MGYGDENAPARAMTYDAPEIPTRGVSAELDRLTSSVAGLEDALARLRKRLGPVLIPEPPVIAAANDDRPLGLVSHDDASALRERVRSASRVVERMSGEVNSLVGLVDL